MFERGGRKLTKCCSRLATLRLKLKGGKDIYIINGHAPDSGQTVVKRQAFQQKLERALRAAGSNDALVLMGNFNAAVGTAEDNRDEASGEHGISHVNAAGKELKMLATAHGLQDLVTVEEQTFYGTWVHPQSKLWHQLDRIFMKKSQRHMVNKCRNAEMLKVSDHFSVRINLTMSSPPNPPLTLRQRNNTKNLRDVFSKSADEKVKRERIMEMARQHEDRRKTHGDGFEHLMAAVNAVVETTPVQKREQQGWCDLNFACLNEAVETRNAAARECARTKTEEARLLLKKERDCLKKLKKKAKNEWMLEQLKTCDETVLPGKGDRKNPHALWKLASKLQRGLDKWKSWDDTNVKDANGNVASTPEQNATIFQKNFNSLFSDDVVSTGAVGEHKKMSQVEIDRAWSPPQMWEMKAELKKMK
jgi:hypothetical protein